MKKKLTWFDKYMTAATFAEANLADTAREYLQTDTGPKTTTTSKSKETATTTSNLNPKMLHAKF